MEKRVPFQQRPDKMSWGFAFHLRTFPGVEIYAGLLLFFFISGLDCLKKSFHGDQPHLPT